MGLDAQQIRRGNRMPPPFTALWRIRMCAEILLRRRQECAAVQHRDEVPAALLWGDAFGNEERGSIKGDLRAEFLARDEMLLVQERHGEARTVDLRALVADVEADGQTLRFSLRSDSSASNARA